MNAAFERVLTPYFLLLPQVLLVVVFFLWPALEAVWESLQAGDIYGVHSHFVGFSHYCNLLADKNFYFAWGVSLAMALSITCIVMSLGFVFAYALFSIPYNPSYYKALILWPYAVAPAVAAMLWRFLCQPVLGYLVVPCGWLGIDFHYLTHPIQAFVTVVLAASWQQLSYNFLMYWIALRQIPRDTWDAASLDAAGSLRYFKDIVWPLLKPTSAFLFIMNMLFGFFDTFGTIDILTRGGPNDVTTTVVYKAFRDGFVHLDSNRSATESVILMLVLGGLSFYQLRWLSRRGRGQQHAK